SILTGGSYTVNPAFIATETVWAADLIGGELNVVMGVNTATVTTPGIVASVPSNPVAQASTSGSGTGATFTMTYAPVTVTGTTGTGTKFTATGTVASGALSGALTVVIKGNYTVNPTSLAAEPVTGGGLTGCTLVLVMGVNTASVLVPGVVATVPSNPVAQNVSSGVGTGATFTMTYPLVTVTGTTGTGTKFQATGALTAGALSGALTITVNGNYTVNPTSLTAEPVTGNGLTGCTIGLIVGVNSATVTTPGVVTAVPSNPVVQASSSGAGTGATFTMTYT